MPRRRPDQHVIGTLAHQQFESVLPPEWVCRSLPHDYGLDAEIEVFEEGLSTGLKFQVQIRGKRRPRLLSGGSVVSLAMDVDHVQYLCHEVNVPSLLVAVDVETPRAWWCAIQLDTDLTQRLGEARSKRQRSIVVHVPTANALPATSPGMVGKARESGLSLGLRSVTRASRDALHAAIEATEDTGELLAALQRGASVARLQELSRRWRQDDRAGARALVEETLTDPAADPYAKFAAYGYAERLEVDGLPAHQAPHAEWHVVQQLKQASRGWPLDLRASAALASRAAQLHILATHDQYLYMNAGMHQQRPDGGMFAGIWGIALPEARHRTASAVVRKLGQCTRLLGFMARRRVWQAIPRSVARVLTAMDPFMLRLYREGMQDAAGEYDAFLTKLAESGIGIARELNDWTSIALLISLSMFLADPRDEASVSRRLAWAQTAAAAIAPDDVRAELLCDVDAIVQGWSKPEGVTDDTGEPLALRMQAIEGMAAAIGVDVTDEHDEIAEVIRVGLLDYDPSRVLRECRHLYVALSGGGLPAHALGLPTAGSKTLWCTRHGHGRGAFRLDDAYMLVDAEHCSACPDKAPRPDVWQWSVEWQTNEAQKHGKRFRSL